MLLHIIRKEILENLLSLRFAMACVLCLCVVLVSMFVRGIDYQQGLDDYHENSLMDEKRIDEIRYPWNLEWMTIKLHKRPNPLKLFVQGMENSYRSSLSFRRSEPQRFLAKRIRNASIPLFPSVDLVFFVGVIMSLMALVFGYDAVCGEKERGTLRLMLSCSVPRDQLLLGKWIGGYLTLVFPFITMMGGAGAILMMQKGIELTTLHWMRILGIVLLSLLYLAVVYSLSIWVSCITKKSATSIVVLLTLWVVLVLAIPNLSPYLGGLVKSMPNRNAMEKERQQAQLRIQEEVVDKPVKQWEADHGLGERWWENWDWNDPEKRKIPHLRWAFATECRQRATGETFSAYDKIEEKYRNEMDNHVRAAEWLSRISPYSCFSLAAVSLAGQGVYSQRSFIGQAREYQKQFLSYAQKEIVVLNSLQIEGKATGSDYWKKHRKKIPRFKYKAVGGTAMLRLVVVDAGILLGMALVFFGLAFFAFLRYDVR